MNSKIFYHWIKKSVLEKIMKEGLIRNKHLGAVCLTSESGIASWKERVGGEVLLRVSIDYDDMGKFFEPEGSHYCLKLRNCEMFCFNKNIKPNQIKIINGDER